jgi:DHA1 family tetracycline resistance protein-like MFS transporter
VNLPSGNYGRKPQALHGGGWGIVPRAYVLMMAATCESAALGLIAPSLPALYAHAMGTTEVAGLFGAMLTLYALVNLFAAPVLGTLSDRFGRRPLLLLSFAGLTVECLMMAIVPLLPLLVVGRVLSGLTNSTWASITASIADMTAPGDRATRFGYLNASYGIGLFFGPLIGGLMAEWRPEASFSAAAILAALGFLLVLLSPMPRSAVNSAVGKEAISINPLKHLRWMVGMGILPLAAVYLAVNFSFQAPGTLWVIYTSERFLFSPAMIGISMAVFGLLYAATQIFITGPFAARFGAEKMALAGIGTDMAATVALALVTQGWMIFPLLVPLAFCGISNPALQTLLARQVGNDQQGRLQGALASVVAVAAIAAPLTYGTLYSATHLNMPGAAWLLSPLLYLSIVPIWLLTRRRSLASRKMASSG